MESYVSTNHDSGEEVKEVELTSGNVPSEIHTTIVRLKEGKEDNGRNDITEHKLSLQELQTKYEVDIATGLSGEEALRRLKADGPNSLTPPARKPIWLRFLLHLVGGFSLLLWAGSILCFIVYGLNASVENLTLGIVLAAVVTLTGIFSFYQEMKSEKVLAGFMKLSPTTCDVLRDGQFMYSNFNLHYLCFSYLSAEQSDRCN